MRRSVRPTLPPECSPDPWALVPAGEFVDIVAIPEVGDEIVVARQLKHSDAQVAVAAPALLSACTRLIEAHEAKFGPDDRSRPEIESARAAVYRATNGRMGRLPKR